MVPDLAREVGRDIRSKRLAAGMRLAELSHITGISEPALSMLENGNGNPTLRTLTKVCEALGVWVAVVDEPSGLPVSARSSGEAITDGEPKMLDEAAAVQRRDVQC